MPLHAPESKRPADLVRWVRTVKKLQGSTVGSQKK